MTPRRPPSRKDIRATMRALAAAAPDQERAAAAGSTLGLDKPERIRAKPRDLEGDEQKALFLWAKYEQNRFPELQYLFHVPNGGARDAITGARLKAQGVKPGVPDIYLDVARACYHGLRIELKAGKGKANDDQHNWILNLQAQGYYAQVCVGWEAARDLIVKYLTS
jgi:hypothetical protein